MGGGAQSQGEEGVPNLEEEVAVEVLGLAVEGEVEVPYQEVEGEGVVPYLEVGEVVVVAHPYLEAEVEVEEEEVHPYLEEVEEEVGAGVVEGDLEQCRRGREVEVAEGEGEVAVQRAVEMFDRYKCVLLGGRGQGRGWQSCQVRGGGREESPAGGMSGMTWSGG